VVNNHSEMRSANYAEFFESDQWSIGSGQWSTVFHMLVWSSLTWETRFLLGF